MRSSQTTALHPTQNSTLHPTRNIVFLPPHNSALRATQEFVLPGAQYSTLYPVQNTVLPPQNSALYPTQGSDSRAPQNLTIRPAQNFVPHRTRSPMQPPPAPRIPFLELSPSPVHDEHSIAHSEYWTPGHSTGNNAGYRDMSPDTYDDSENELEGTSHQDMPPTPTARHLPFPPLGLQDHSAFFMPPHR
jgi:hypothetical protein